MFTGIISHLGKVIQKSDDHLQISAGAHLLKQLSDGMSVSVNGICLTVVDWDTKSFSVDFMPETAIRTTINSMEKGSMVNLELPATPQTFLAGHIVQGHVDAVGEITVIFENGNSRVITISIPKHLSKYIVEKGSITLNGISLTVIEIGKDYFTVGIIPHTWDNTMLHTAEVSNKLNIEVDVLAKYIEKLIIK